VGLRVGEGNRVEVDVPVAVGDKGGIVGNCVAGSVAVNVGRLMGVAGGAARVQALRASSNKKRGSAGSEERERL
jgi:hypothetical protein